MAMRTDTHNPEDTEMPAGVGRCAVTCPMCGFKHIQYRLNPRMFWNTGMDMDRKPTEYQSLKGLAGLHPPLYELWQCPQCHFTAHNRNFPDPLKDVFIEKGIVPRQLAEAQAGDTAFGRVCRALAVSPAFDEINFNTAIRTVLMEIHFARFLIDLIRQGYGAIARSYLRLAWLHRDWQQMDPQNHDADLTALNTLLGTVKPDWDDVPFTEQQALGMACAYYEKAITEPAIENDPRELAATLQHLARIRLQMGDGAAARTHLDDARRQAIDEQNRLNAIRQEDNRQRNLTEEERARLVSDVRRLQVIVDDCTDLIAGIKKTAAASPSPQAAQPSGSEKNKPKKSLLRGLFSG